MGEGPSRPRSGLSKGVAASVHDVDPTALPSASHSGVDSRVVAVWCEWLDALATDAEAALAAAMAYKALDDTARDRWLSALDQDAARVRVPRVALYAPLLAVEGDAERRARIAEAMGPLDEQVTPHCEARALTGRAADGTRIALVVSPLYLDFVQVLACGYRMIEGFSWVRHDPIVQRSNAPRCGDVMDGVVVEATPLRDAVDELALVVLAHNRSGRELPEALKMFADLFGPVYEAAPAIP